MELIKISSELQGIDESKAQQIKECFDPMVQMLTRFEGAYDEVVKKDISPDVCAQAKRLRLDISKVRIEADKVRKAQKEQYLRAGNAIQGVYNILRYAVEDKENRLKKIETHYERIEQERKAKLQDERSREIEQYGDFPGVDFGSMTDDVWNNFLLGAKSSYQARVEAERKAEEDRIKAEKEAERRRKEAEKKRIEEARQKAKEEAEKRAQAEAERKEREYQQALERERREAERKAAEEKRRYEQKIAEQKRQEKLEQERKEKILKDEQHKAKIHKEAIMSLIGHGFSEDMAKSIISYIARGAVAHVSVRYY